MNKISKFGLLLSACMVFLGVVGVVTSTPDTATVTILSNTTKAAGNGAIANLTNDGLLSGGYIFTMNLSGDSQNLRWKAFVGNASGTLTLDNADGDTIFDWSLSTISGEVYATRQSGAINWTGINCAPLNATEIENINLSHTSADDNITKTFAGIDNQQMIVGTTTITANTCRTANIYTNSSDPVGNTDNWEEIVLYDRGNISWDQNQSSFGNIVYAQNLHTDSSGYANTSTYDFQMIVPERGQAVWTSSTAYYFYLELS